MRLEPMMSEVCNPSAGNASNSANGETAAAKESLNIPIQKPADANDIDAKIKQLQHDALKKQNEYSRRAQETKEERDQAQQSVQSRYRR